MIHADANFKSLGFARAWVFAVWLLVLVPDRLSDLSAMPVEIFEPYGILKLVPESLWEYLFTPVFLFAFKWLLVAGLIVCVLGVGPYRPVAITTVLMLTLYQGMVRGFGFINHGELGLLYAAYVMAWFPAHLGFSLTRQRPESDSAPSPVAALGLQTIAVVLLATYTVIATHRITHAAPEVFLNGTMTFYLGRASMGTDYYGMRFAGWALEHPMVLGTIALGFAVITLFELLSFFCLVSKRFRIAWLAVMVPFHVSTLMFMNIFFWENLLLAGVVLVNITAFVSPGLRARVRKPLILEEGFRAFRWPMEMERKKGNDRGWRDERG